MKIVILDPRSSDPTWGDADEAVFAEVPDEADAEPNMAVPEHTIKVSALPDLLEILRRLQIQVNHANTIQHSGVDIGPSIWADLYQTCNEARAVIAKAEGGAE